jgi:hypothetical protein
LTVRVSTASRATAQEFGNAAEATAAARVFSGHYNWQALQPPARSASNAPSSSSGHSAEAAAEQPAPEPAVHPTEALLLDDRVVRLTNAPLRCACLHGAC